MKVTEGSEDIIPEDFDSIRKACEEANVVDVDLVLDIYAICRVKSDNVDFKDVEETLERFDKADPIYWASRVSMSRRMEHLEVLSKTNYVAAMVDVGDPLKAVYQFIHDIGEVVKKKQADQNNGKPLIDCDLSAAQETADAVVDHDAIKTGEELQDSLDAAEADCMRTDSVDSMLNDMTTYHDITEDDAASAFAQGGSGYVDPNSPHSEPIPPPQHMQGTSLGIGDSGVFSQDYCVGRQLAQSIVTQGYSLPQNFPKFFDIFKAACDDIGTGAGVDRESESAKVVDTRKMEDLVEMTTVDPAELASETFDAKAANKSFEVARTVEPEEGRSHLFVLLDVSASMEEIGSGGVPRAFSANVVSLALLKYAMEDKYKVWIIPFAGSVDERNVQEATDKQSALDAMRWLGSLSYNGWGTSIDTAILYAYRQLDTDPQYKKCEIVLITDGESAIKESIITKKPNNCTLRTILLASTRGSSQAMQRLHRASRSVVKLGWNGKQGKFEFDGVFDGIESWFK